MENTLFIVSAPSGSGKTSIMRKAMGKKSEILSYTTRPARNGEQDGVDYHFVSKEEFQAMDEKGDMIEKTQYPPNDPNGNFYGVSWEAVESKLKKEDAFIVVDAYGMKQLKAIHPNCITIWIKASKTDVIENMRVRGDSIENIKNRIATFDIEQGHSKDYDYVVSNKFGRMKDAVNIIKSIAIVNATTVRKKTLKPMT